jgi:oxalate decarboxylase
MLDDWLAHTPIDVIAKNFGVNASVFANIPTSDPYILNATVSTDKPSGGNGPLTGDASFVYQTLSKAAQPVPGTGGEFYKIDSTNFPIATTIASTFVRLKPGGLRELHWHPNVSTLRSLPCSYAYCFIGSRMALLPSRYWPRYRFHWWCHR